jgi:HNH endonuclease
MGEVYSSNIKKLCRSVVLPSGYHKIKLKGDNGVYKDLYIHVLVAIAYMHHTPMPNYVVNHIDGNKGNNAYSNLEVITHKENMQHSVKMNDSRIFRRAVCYTDKNDKLVHFRSAKEASVKTGIDNSSILKSCKSDTKLAGMIKWSYMSTS